MVVCLCSLEFTCERYYTLKSIRLPPRNSKFSVILRHTFTSSRIWYRQMRVVGTFPGHVDLFCFFHFESTRDTRHPKELRHKMGKWYHFLVVGVRIYGLCDWKLCCRKRRACDGRCITPLSVHNSKNSITPRAIMRAHFPQSDLTNKQVSLDSIALSNRSSLPTLTTYQYLGVVQFRIYPSQRNFASPLCSTHLVQAKPSSQFKPVSGTTCHHSFISHKKI